jgi:hypothetical protein
VVERAKLGGKIPVAALREVGKPGIGHWLPAAGLAVWHHNLAPYLFEQAQRCDSHSRVKLIDVTGNKQTNAHA